MKYDTVLWDFDGVWSKDKFYKSLEKSNPDIFNFIQTNIWGPSGRVDKWMRAEMTAKDINKFISQETKINFDLLNNIFINDVAQMIIEMRHVPIVQQLRQQGIKVGMVTNNMDVFTQVTLSRLDLLNLFNGQVFNSFDHRVLKADGLYDIAMDKIGAQYATTLLIDDSPRARDAFEIKGGHTYAYTNFEDFDLWVKNNL